MECNRRSFLGAGAIAAAVTIAGGSASAGSEHGQARGRRFVGACPGVINTIDRKPGPTRIMVIGAHPDDADNVCGCFSLKLIEKGYKVKFVSITDGLDAQVSQFYDWLPWDTGTEDEVKALGDRKDIKARNAYILKHWVGRKRYDAKRYAAAWKEQYPDKPVPAYMEAYEVSEYGRAPNDEDFKILLGE